jgi:hypothetical protein
MFLLFLPRWLLNLNLNQGIVTKLKNYVLPGLKWFVLRQFKYDK